MSGFFVTKRDRMGQTHEVELGGYGPGRPQAMTAAEALEASRARIADVLPHLLHETEQNILKLEAALPAEGSIQRGPAIKELDRFRFRRACLAEGRIACLGRSQGLDNTWSSRVNPLVGDAVAAGVAVDDEYRPSGSATVTAAAPAGLLAQFREVASKIKRIEAAIRKSAVAAGMDRGRSLDLVDRADMAGYVAAHLDTGYVPNNPEIGRDIEIFNMLIPLWSAAKAAGLLITVDHSENVAWLREQGGR